MASEPPKFRGSPNFFLTKHQLSVFLCLLFESKFLIGLFSVKTGFEELKKKFKKIWLKKIFGNPRNLLLALVSGSICSFIENQDRQKNNI